MHVGEIPEMFAQIIRSAFNKCAITGGIEGGLMAAVLQGVKRGTFSSAAGMGESTPAASATETSHPVKVGLANAAGVFLDTIIVCTATGFMILLTNCFNTSESIGGYQSQVSALVGKEGGVIYVQEAAKTVLGGFAPTFIAVVLFLFSFTCIFSYYYESETSAMYLFRKNGREKQRKAASLIIKVVMLLLVLVWGISESGLAWDVADFALGTCTWINIVMLWFLFPKARALYLDYEEQKRKGIDPFYNPNKESLCWDGVDAEMWLQINKKRQH